LIFVLCEKHKVRNTNYSPSKCFTFGSAGGKAHVLLQPENISV
jgi:hypothetical protein